MENWSARHASIPTSFGIANVKIRIKLGDYSPNQASLSHTPSNVTARNVVKQRVRIWRGQENALTMSIITAKTTVLFSRSTNAILPYVCFVMMIGTTY